MKQLWSSTNTRSPRHAPFCLRPCGDYPIRFAEDETCFSLFLARYFFLWAKAYARITSRHTGYAHSIQNIERHIKDFRHMHGQNRSITRYRMVIFVLDASFYTPLRVISLNFAKILFPRIAAALAVLGSSIVKHANSNGTPASEINSSRSSENKTQSKRI